MNTLRKLLIGIALAGAALATAPAALADKYVENHYYGYSQYRDHDRHYDHHRDRHHERRYDRHRHDRYCDHRGHARKRVVVIERPHHYPSHSYYSEPRYERRVYSGEYRSATPMILGGIIGGAVGNTMGKGHGRDAATVAGAILGGSIGRDMGEYY